MTKWYLSNISKEKAKYFTTFLLWAWSDPGQNEEHDAHLHCSLSWFVSGKTTKWYLSKIYKEKTPGVEVAQGQNKKHVAHLHYSLIWLVQAKKHRQSRFGGEATTTQSGTHQEINGQTDGYSDTNGSDNQNQDKWFLKKLFQVSFSVFSQMKGRGAFLMLSCPSSVNFVFKRLITQKLPDNFFSF